jgi:hypothetical protein
MYYNTLFKMNLTRKVAKKVNYINEWSPKLCSPIGFHPRCASMLFLTQGYIYIYIQFIYPLDMGILIFKILHWIKV